MLNWLIGNLNFSHTFLITPYLSTNIALELRTSLTSNCFALLIMFMYIITTIYSFGYLTFERDKHKVRFHIFTFFAVLMGIGLAYSNNLFTAFVFYDLLSFFTYMLVRHHKDENSEEQAFKYAMYLILPAMLFLLPAIILVYNIVGHTNYIVGGLFTNIPISKMFVNILFLMFMYGITKTALYPLHKWLICAMVAPSPVSALLHAVLVVKGGLYFMYRVIYEIFGLEFLRENIYYFYGLPWPIYIAISSIILAGISAIASENIKQRLAYSTISQIGYISMCLFCFTEEAITGAKMQFMAHSFAKISLFYYAGYLLARYHISNVSELKFKRNHFNIILSVMWLIPAFSLMSMPLTIGYISKHSIIRGTLHNINDVPIFITLIVGMFLCIFYLYPIVRHLVLFNNKNERKFVGQYFSTFAIYFSISIIAIMIIISYFFVL